MLFFFIKRWEFFHCCSQNCTAIVKMNTWSHTADDFNTVKHVTTENILKVCF